MININKNNRIAIVGCGYWGSIIANNLRKLTDQEIYVFDSNTKNSKNLKKKIKNLKIVNNISEILINNKIKFVFLVVPPNQTFKILKKLINFKKNVFVEKPFLSSLKNIDIIKKLLKKKKTTLMVGYIYLYNEIIKKIKTILNQNVLGKILFIKCIRENLGPIRSEVDCNFDLASHDLSILKYLLENKLIIKNRIDHKILKKNIADSSTLKLISKNISIEIRSSWLSTEKVRKIIIVGSKRMLLFDEMLEKNQLKIFNQYAKYPEITKLGKKIFSETARVYKGNVINISYKKNNPLLNEIKNFFKYSVYKTKPKTDIFFAEKILKILIFKNG